jgi:hypothetical protein
MPPRHHPLLKQGMRLIVSFTLLAEIGRDLREQLKSGFNVTGNAKRD